MKCLVQNILLISAILCGHKLLACAPQQKFQLQSQQRLQAARPTTDPYFQRPSSSLNFFGVNQTPNYLKILFGQPWGTTANKNFFGSTGTTANRNLFGSTGTSANRNLFGSTGTSANRNLFGSLGTSANKNLFSSTGPSTNRLNFFPNIPKPQSQIQLFTATPSPTVGVPSTSPSITFRAQPHQPTCPSTTPTQNKNLVILFYQRTFGDKNLQNLEQYLLPTYIQHNPGVPDGIDGFITLFTTGALRGQPPIKVDFKRVSAENDLVWVHTRLPLQNPTSTFSVMDIFRVECGKIAEHWDVLQEITPSILRNARNSHPFF